VGDWWIPLLGGALLTFAAWGWLGRSHASRWWVRSWEGDSLILGVLPGMGLVLFGLGLVAVFNGPLQTIGSLLWLAGFPVFVLGFLTPRWWGPGWYRRMSPQQRQRAQRDAVGTFLRSRDSSLPESSADRAARAFGASAQPVGSWRAGYVYDPDTKDKAHTLARRGTVDGRLTAYVDGVVFAASATEDGLRGEPTVVTVGQDRLTGARVVPARAGADGRPRPGLLNRSLFPRLVLDTTEGSHVFEIAFGRARKAANVVNETAAGQRA
jgi:hypothetical protein